MNITHTLRSLLLAAACLPLAACEASASASAPLDPAVQRKMLGDGQMMFLIDACPTVGQEAGYELESAPDSGCCWQVKAAEAAPPQAGKKERAEVSVSVEQAAPGRPKARVSLTAKTEGEFEVELYYARAGEAPEQASMTALISGYAFPAGAGITDLGGREGKLELRLAQGQSAYFRFEDEGDGRLLFPGERWFVKDVPRGAAPAVKSYAFTAGGYRYIRLTGAAPGKASLQFYRSTYLCKHPKVSRRIEVQVEVGG